MGIAGLLAALVRAQRTGEGDHVDVAMTDGAFALQALLLGAFFAEDRDPGIETELLNGGYPCYNVYECADGRQLTVGPLEEPFWRELCDAVERPDLLPTQFDPGSAIPVWRELFATRPRDDWLAAFAGRDVCAGPLNKLSEATADPQLLHRGMITEQEHPTAGPVPQIGTPIKFRERHAGPARTRAGARRVDLVRARRGGLLSVMRSSVCWMMGWPRNPRPSKQTIGRAHAVRIQGICRAVRAA